MNGSMTYVSKEESESVETVTANKAGLSGLMAGVAIFRWKRQRCGRTFTRSSGATE
jgi:hypothetical protein